MTEVVLCTIPYTGTNFTEQLFTRCGLEAKALNDKPSDGSIYVGHMLKEGQVRFALELGKSRLLVCGLRHPYRVEESGRRKNADVAALMRAYATLVTRFLPAGAVIMPVDSPRRHEAIKTLRLLSGMNLQTDWSPVSARSSTWDMNLTDFSPSNSAKHVLRRYRRFFDYYYQGGEKHCMDTEQLYCSRW